MAEKFYERVSEKGVAPCYTTWELLTWGYLKEKQMDKALHYLNKAIGTVEKWQYDKKLIAQLFENLQEHGNVEGAEALLVILQNAGHVSTEVYNSLLQTYAKAGVMPLVIAERMKKDGVPMNDETSKLLDETSKINRVLFESSTVEKELHGSMCGRGGEELASVDQCKVTAAAP
ncbi:hypothetical protein NL676_002610 [Syzygium grande]|nr:hypothetical protein NL676_002610 [Syzygium grande]